MCALCAARRAALAVRRRATVDDITPVTEADALEEDAAIDEEAPADRVVSIITGEPEAELALEPVTEPDAPGEGDVAAEAA